MSESVSDGGPFLANASSDEQVNTEAGDYIEDDPEAWVSWVETVRRYAPEYERLVRHLNGGEEAASEILAGTMLSYLADRHGIFLIRGDAQRVEQRVEQPTAKVDTLAHELRTYAAHAQPCAYNPTYPDFPVATCDCGFDAVLERYDRLGAE